MECLLGLLQKNVLNQRRWPTRADLAYEITFWIEHSDNRGHRHRRLGRFTPVEFELAFAPATASSPA